MDSDVNVTQMTVILTSSIGNSTSNVTTIGHSKAAHSYSLTPLTQMQVILYILMAVVGVVGNTLTITVLLKPEYRKRRSSIMLMNLAVCDVIIAALCIPLDIGYFINGKWIYGENLCYVISPFQTSMPIVSSWTFMFMMLERNSLFTKSMRRQMRRKSIRILAAITWIIPVALVIPYGIRLQFSTEKGVDTCNEKWESEIGRKLYTVLLSVCEFLVPMLMITCFVIRISVNLSRQSRQLKKNSLGLNLAKRKSRLRQNKNITLTFIVMVTLYAALKLPNNVFWQWYEFGDGGTEEQKNLIWTFVSLAAYSTSMVNPLVLAAMSNEFRKEFICILRCQACFSSEAICLMFRRTNSDSTDVVTSPPNSPNPAYKIVQIDMNDLGKSNAESSIFPGGKDLSHNRLLLSKDCS